ncbi:uncharacterized protein SPSK_04751 [Sporothrix schenckii 1099-18]|nr:uncharacterized protein SPSK_04751 [Sporothrix schenckii 1099-18]KJR83022.1 hypothetical protein SPSK_04751 [Sporothrix schenckii 1099-18]
MTQASATPGVIDAAMPAPPAAWWMTNFANMSSTANPNADPTALQAAQQVVNPDFNYELLGLNLGDLWADYSWEDI